MPFKGFLCMASGDPVTAAACLSCARHGALPGCQMTSAVVNGIIAGLRPDDFGLTATVLLGCPRKRRLMDEYDYWLPIDQAWWSYRGQLMHGVCASYAADDPNAVAEKRYFTKVNGRQLSGQPDLFYVDRRHLVDYKTIKSVPGPWRQWLCPETGEVIREGAAAYRNKWLTCPHCELGEHEAKAIETLGAPRPYPKHVQQVSIYRYLLSKQKPPIRIDTCEIVYMDMAQIMRLDVTGQLLSLADTRQLIAERLALLTRPELPDILRDPQEVWECDFCPARAKCEELYGDYVGKAMTLSDEAVAG